MISTVGFMPASHSATAAYLCPFSVTAERTPVLVLFYVLLSVFCSCLITKEHSLSLRMQKLWPINYMQKHFYLFIYLFVFHRNHGLPSYLIAFIWEDYRGWTAMSQFQDTTSFSYVC